MTSSVVREYLEWLQNLISGGKYGNYTKLIAKLYSREFIWNDGRFPGDRNRAIDGMDLRFRFANESGYDNTTVERYLDSPCTILEMMIALSDRCEHQIMEEWDDGPNPGRWFWRMIVNMNLDGCDDEHFEEEEDYIDSVLDDFIQRRYQRNGRGGLFSMTQPKKDMRKMEIWYQMNGYLCEMLGY